MSNAREVAQAYWSAIEARDWAVLGALLTDDVHYQIPQTGEWVQGRAAYVRFNAEYPGQWHVEVERAIGDGTHAATWIRFIVDGATQPALTFLDLADDGRIARITDFWPEPYEPPPGREHLLRR